MNDEPLSLQQLNRTFIGSVLFIDIVGYSRGTVPEQIAMKEVFIRLLTEAVQYVAPGDRIMADTGDGAGIAFLGDPEDALFTALSLRDAIDAGKVAMGEPGFVRMGINLGPLKMVRDINGHTNMIGDAVNDAQRVMSFAAAGQVMVSHSYYDIISRFSVDYAKLFSYEGARRDKHVREHQVYSFGHSADVEILAEKLRDRSRARNPNSIMPTHFDDAEPEPAAAPEPVAPSPPPSRAAAPAAVKPPAPATKLVKQGTPFRLGLVASIILCVVGVSGAAVAWYMYDKTAVVTARNAAPIAAAMTPAAASPPAAAGSAASQNLPKAVVAPTASPAVAAVVTPAADPASAAAAASNVKAASTPAASATTLASATADGASANQPGVAAVAANAGTLTLSIEPWGEVFVDGASSGISPPLKSLKLAPGKHKIEIRNSEFTPYRKTIQVKSDADVAVHYVF